MKRVLVKHSTAVCNDIKVNTYIPNPYPPHPLTNSSPRAYVSSLQTERFREILQFDLQNQDGFHKFPGSLVGPNTFVCSLYVLRFPIPSLWKPSLVPPTPFVCTDMFRCSRASLFTHASRKPEVAVAEGPDAVTRPNVSGISHATNRQDRSAGFGTPFYDVLD